MPSDLRCTPTTPQMRTHFLSALLFATVALAATSCNKDEAPLLTPAREIVGTWKMAFPVTFYYETTRCDFVTMQLMATEKRLVTWVISEDSSEPDGNHVRITMTYDDSDFTILQLCLGSTGIIPEVRPIFLTGVISGAYLTVYSGQEVYGDFSFTTSNMEGNWDADVCSIWCQHIYTVNREFKLNKQ